MGQASHVTGPRRRVRRNDDDINAYDDYDDDDEGKKNQTDCFTGQPTVAKIQR